MTLADVRPGLRAHLLGDSAISTRVGGARIYPIKMPQGQTLEGIVYSRISGFGDHHMQGPSGLGRPRFQIDSWSPAADGASSLSRLVKERIDGFRGTISYGSNSPQSTVEVLGVFLDSERDDYDDSAQMYRVSMDFFVWFRES